MRRPPIPRLLLYGLAATLVVALVVAASTSALAFGAYNLEWDGTSDFRALADDETESTVALDTEPYTTIEPNGTLAVVLAPAEPYAAEDADRVRRFVEDGGTLLVADNFGPTDTTAPYGNTLLADVGADARLDGDPLRDERRYYRSPAFPVASNVSEHPYTNDVDELTFNHGTAVEPSGAETLVRTSEFAYLDRNRSGDLDDDEELARYPVVTIEAVGDGHVVTLGDPSLFINSMLERDGNAAFATALFGAHERTLLDYTYSGDQPPLTVALLGLRGSVPLQLLVGLTGVGLVWSVLTRPALCSVFVATLVRKLPSSVTEEFGLTADGESESERAVASEAELVAYLQRQHPEWEEERIQRMIAAIIREEPRRDDDE